MLDLKYSMQMLLARMLHKTNPKASLKAVDGMIQDVEAYVPLFLPPPLRAFGSY